MKTNSAVQALFEVGPVLTMPRVVARRTSTVARMDKPRAEPVDVCGADVKRLAALGVDLGGLFDKGTLAILVRALCPVDIDFADVEGRAAFRKLFEIVLPLCREAGDDLTRADALSKYAGLLLPTAGDGADNALQRLAILNELFGIVRADARWSCDACERAALVNRFHGFNAALPHWQAALDALQHENAREIQTFLAEFLTAFQHDRGQHARVGVTYCYRFKAVGAPGEPSFELGDLVGVTCDELRDFVEHVKALGLAICVDGFDYLGGSPTRCAPAVVNPPAVNAERQAVIDRLDLVESAREAAEIGCVDFAAMRFDGFAFLKAAAKLDESLQALFNPRALAAVVEGLAAGIDHIPATAKKSVRSMAGVLTKLARETGCKTLLADALSFHSRLLEPAANATTDAHEIERFDLMTELFDIRPANKTYSCWQFCDYAALTGKYRGWPSAAPILTKALAIYMNPANGFRACDVRDLFIGVLDVLRKQCEALFGDEPRVLTYTFDGTLSFGVPRLFFFPSLNGDGKALVESAVIFLDHVSKQQTALNVADFRLSAKW